MGLDFISSLVDGVDSFLDYASTIAKTSVSDYCDLESADSKNVLVSKDGSLLSIIKVNGVKQLIGNSTLGEKIITPLTISLQSLFETKAHKMQFVFEVDPDRTRLEIKRVLADAVETAKRLEMDMGDLLSERENNLVNWTEAEYCYVVLWTTPSALSKMDQKNEVKERQKLRNTATASVENGQDPLRGLMALRVRHDSYVNAVMEEMGGVGISVSLLNAHNAVKEIRRSIDDSFTSDDWSPCLPGDRVLPSIRKNAPAAEFWDIVWPKLGWQICPRDANIIDNNIVEIGDRIFYPMFIDLFQKDLQFFQALFARTKGKGFPWRINYMIEGDGLSDFSFKGLLGQLLGFASSGNKMISAAVRGLQEYQEKAGGTVVKIRASLLTWAPKGEMDLLRSRASDLARCVESWGSCQVSEVTGDPIAGVFSSTMGVTQGNIGTAAASPLDEALALMPLSRPSSPWDAGAVTFRTPDGKLMPYQPYSSKQVTWINLIFAKPGSGKSVLMNLCNLALCLAAGQQYLPRIAIIDIGPSSEGLISLLKESLPKHKRHLVMHHRLQMTESNSINPFDTQLGCRYPTPSEIAFLQNFVLLLVTDVNSSIPYDGMAGLVKSVVDEVFRLRSDKNEPSLYSKNTYPDIDLLISKEGIVIDSKTTWWEVVDELFRKGFYYEAKLAQRQAVPILTDCTVVSQSEKIRNTYGQMNTPTGESLVSAFTRLIGEALDFFPILARPTSLDLGDARVVALDLDDVAKTGGAVADRITSGMYMLARQILAKDYYLNDKVVPEMPAPANVQLRDTVPVEEYRAYHLERIKEILECPKRICYDEFHRTSKSQQVRDQVLIDMREGRKWRVDVMLASQAIEDFDKTMMEFATGVFVMDGGNAQTLDKVANAFGFVDPAERYALQYRVTGPKRGGGVFLAKFSTTSGWYSMLLSATLGPIELWSFNTTALDVSLRSRLYQKVGPKKARKILASKFPGGSAVEEIEGRRSLLKFQTENEANKNADIIEALSEELIAQYKDM